MNGVRIRNHEVLRVPKGWEEQDRALVIQLNRILDDLYARFENKYNAELKADKVAGAVAGNFAGLDSSGNLTDSGHKHSDYATKAEGVTNITRSGTTFTVTRADGTTFTFTQQDNDHYAWSDITNKPDTATRWPAWSEVTSKPSYYDGGAVTNITRSGTTFTATKLDGTTFTFTQSWRGIQDNLTSSTNTTESLSAKQGYLLANGSARDNTKRADTAPASGSWFRGTPKIESDGVMEVGKYIDFHDSNASTADYSARITASSSGLTLSGTTSGTFSGNLSGNATTATKVQDAGDTSKSLSIRYSGAGASATDWIPMHDSSGNLVPVSSTNLANKVRDKASGSWSITASNNIPYNTARGIAYCEGGGSNWYFRIATINITSSYINRPIVFEMSQRGYKFCHIQTTFASVNSTDPGLGSFVTDSEQVYYIKKVATSKWEIYGKYSEQWGEACLHRITGLGANIGVTVDMVNIGTTEPSGVTTAGFYLNAAWAGNGISNITRSGTTFTVTRANGTTFTFTQQDNNTTYSAGNGLSLSGTTFSVSWLGLYDGSATINTTYCTGSCSWKACKVYSNRRIVNLTFDINFKSSYSSSNVAVIATGCPVPVAGGQCFIVYGTSVDMGKVGLVTVDGGNLKPWYVGNVSGHWLGAITYIATA